MTLQERLRDQAAMRQMVQHYTAAEIMTEAATRIDELEAEVARLRAALELLITRADDSDGSCHSTLSTRFVRNVCREAIDAALTPQGRT